MSRSSSAAPGWPSRPAALMRGASRNAIAPVSIVAGSTPPARMSACRPGLSVRASRRIPAATSARFSSTSGTTSATVASATRSRWRSRSVGAERLEELEDDPGAAQLRERVLRTASWPRSGSPGSVSPGPVVVGDDHLEPGGPGLGDLLDGRDPAVDGEDERAALLAPAAPASRARRRSPPRTGSAGATRRPRPGRAGP